MTAAKIMVTSLASEIHKDFQLTNSVRLPGFHQISWLLDHCINIVQYDCMCCILLLCTMAMATLMW